MCHTLKFPPVREIVSFVSITFCCLCNLVGWEELLHIHQMLKTCEISNRTLECLNVNSETHNSLQERSVWTDGPPI